MVVTTESRYAMLVCDGTVGSHPFFSGESLGKSLNLPSIEIDFFSYSYGNNDSVRFHKKDEFIIHIYVGFSPLDHSSASSFGFDFTNSSNFIPSEVRAMSLSSPKKG